MAGEREWWCACRWKSRRRWQQVDVIGLWLNLEMMITAAAKQAAEKSVNRLATTAGAKAPAHLTRLTRS